MDAGLELARLADDGCPNFNDEVENDDFDLAAALDRLADDGCPLAA